MLRLKPDLQPAEADAFEALAAFGGSWLSADPVRVTAVPGAVNLLQKLSAIVTDIRGSEFYANEVVIDQAETTALVFFGRLFAAARPDHVAHARLARWISAFAAQAAPVVDYPVGRSTWHTAAKSARRILIVSGRNRKAHRELLLWPKELHLEPVVLEAHSAQGSATTAEALETAMGTCGTAIVVATADDEGRLVVDEDGRTLRPGQNKKLQPRARQNVVLELGMVWGQLGRDRLILLLEETVDLGTDTAGFMTICFSGDVRTSFEDLRKRLQAMAIIALRPS